MLSWRLQTGSEKAELQELNARLYEYVCRVRELERENLLLEEELRRRLSQENLWIEDQTRFAEEARNLRQQLDELNWSTALAEGERDALQRELRELQRESAEASAARSRLDAELSAERRELEEALGARAALEALLGRLEAERRDLDAVHERQVRELRARAASLTMHFRARATGPAVPPPRLQNVHDSYALLVAESWRENVQLYEDEVRELEQALRRGQESRLQAEDEARLCAQEADALRNQALELEQLRARLEDELLRMQEEYGIQAEERQRVIDSLEDEKEALTLAMADRLREYQELVQVKTGLSLEVATYRALLEGESNPEILIWRKDIENMPPQESGNASYRYTSSVIQRKNEKNLFPRQKTPWAAVSHSSALYSTRPGHLESQTTTAVESPARRGFPTSGYSSSTTTVQQKSLEKTVSGQASLRPAVPTPGLLRNTDAQVKTFSDRSRVGGTRDTPIRVTTESIVTRESHKDHRGNLAAGAMNNAQSNDRTVVLGKKLEVKTAREQERDRSGVVKLKPEEKMFDSKEKGSEERNLRWEELTKLDRDARARESQQGDEPKEKKSPKERSVKEREVPISLEVSRGSRSEVSTKNLLSSGRKDAGDSGGREAETKETKFRLDTQDAASSLQSESRTETIAENIVTTILKQFTQAPDAEGNDSSLPDTKVTYVDRKELPGSGKTKTEIVLESKLTEDVDVSDEAGLEYLLSKEVKEVGQKGKSAEKMIGEMINIGLKGREGRAKVVNVEIVEEPVSYTGGGTAEFPTAFHVEEVDDVSPSPKGFVEEEDGHEETHEAFSVHQRQRTKQPQGSIPHVEEVTEAGDSEGEQSYFVSTPDEYPGGHDREDDGSVYGQIHIEEESTIRYSWQDEIVQGPWRRKARDDTEKEKHVKVLEVPAPSLGGAVGSAHLKEEASGELHAEPTVIEKEIKIPHEFHTSIKGVFSSEPRHQMAEVIGQLEETLPERMKEELSALTRPDQGEPGNVSVDVKKVQSAAGGSVTLMAEVNLSQTVDADKLDLEELSRDEAGEIERAVESVVRESLTKRSSPMPRSPDREDGEEEVSSGGTLFKRWATRQLYSPSGEKDDAGWSSHSSDQHVTQGPVSATVEVTSPTGFAQSHVLENISQSVRHVKLGPTEMWGAEQASYGGPAAQVVEVSRDFREAASSEGTGRSVKHITLGPHQSHVSTEITFQGSLPTWREAGGTGEPGPAEPSEEADISRNHRMSDSEQFHVEKEIHFLGPVSGTAQVGGSFATEELVGTQTFVRHLQLGPKEGLREEIQFVAPIPDKVEWRVEEDSGNTQVSLGRSTSIHHIDIGPQRHQTSKLIAPQTLEFRDSEGVVLVEGSAGMTQVTHSVTLGREILGNKENTFQTVIPEFPPGSAGDTGAEGTAGTSRSFKHIQIGPAEKGPSEHIVIRGPLSKTFVLDGSAASPELGGVFGDRSTLSPIAPGPKETSFTFQMDVSNTRAVRSWTRDAGSEVEARSVSEHGGWRIAHSSNEQAATMSSETSAGDGHQTRGEKGTEQAGFDKTVQPQRMVDQRSVASDEKKVALVYLDNEEEEDDGWF
ncbi:synemin isoform X1 [Chionomys nivalis]|uniref:synemin isoform X1 n=1 Tax=Chionomys nivalis TaxID=269649 RepID=UPI0025940C71|nr:synemin isoform X1 [Chionomys nivalis]